MLIRAGIALSIAGTALVLHPALTTDPEGWRLLKLGVLSIGAVLAGIGLLLQRASARTFRPRVIDAFVIFYMSWSALGTFFNASITMQRLDELALHAAAILVFVAVARVPARWLIDVIVATACAISFLALLEAIGASLPWSSLRRPFSTLGNRNAVGGYVAIAIPVVVARLGAAGHRRTRAIFAVALSLLVTVVLLTRCRSAWLGLLVAGVLGALHRRKLMARSPRILFASVAIGVALAAIVPWPGLQWNEAHPLAASAARIVEVDRGSGRLRVEQHVTGLSLVRAHPIFGVGARNWETASKLTVADHSSVPRWSTSPTPQSDLLRIAVERGLPAALALLIAAILLVRRAATRWPMVAIAASVVVAGVHAALDVPLFRPESAVAIAALAGLLRRCAPRMTCALPRALGRVSVLASSALVLVVGARALAASMVLANGQPDDIATLTRAQAFFYRQDLEERIAMTLVERGRCEEATAHIERGLREAPASWGLLALADKCPSTWGERGSPR